MEVEKKVEVKVKETAVEKKNETEKTKSPGEAELECPFCEKKSCDDDITDRECERCRCDSCYIYSCSDCYDSMGYCECENNNNHDCVKY